jgi:hypothetical protein
MKPFKDFLGPEATKKQDAAEIVRQKKHLGDKAKEYYDQSEREGGHAAAFAKGITMDLAKKNIKEDDESINEDLRKWFKQKWVRMDTKGNIKGDCAREPGEGKPKCLPQARAHALGKEGRASAAQRKRREDPNPERRGAPINVRTEEVDEACWTGYTAKGMKKKGNRMVPNCVPEETVQEDGMAAGAPVNNVGGGNIAGSGGAGGEPGVSKKRNPLMSFFKRKQPKM